MIVDNNLFWIIIKYIWNIISIFSVFITILSFVCPNNIFTKFIARKIKKHQLKNEDINIQLLQNFDFSKKESIKEYKEQIGFIFSEYDLIVDIDDNLIKGNMERRKFHIKNEFRIPSEEDSFFRYYQEVDIKFKNFYNCMNSLFDNIRTLNKLNSLSINLEDANIRIMSPFFKNNDLIQLLGSNIMGRFTIRKEDENYVLIYNGELSQESLDELKDIIVSFNVF